MIYIRSIQYFYTILTDHTNHTKVKKKEVHIILSTKVVVEIIYPNIIKRLTSLYLSKILKINKKKNQISQRR